ncbi:uncharacterized protein LOC114469942 isoform X2 [Gouania willdenowi]|uniref:uncharacterized protein LOC114469942 isoform X2 n=1 Tax=Gouania willdenowi TaxID=441366 RepID=UPI001056A8F7|nr:uncharacterized protein LOC114469942 isoform X2 [Gouania willdenowi]
MPGGSTKKTCPFCQGILYCAQKVCSHCNKVQPVKQRLRKKLEKFDERREKWAVGRIKHRNVACIKDEAVIMLEKFHAIGYKPILLLGKTKKEQTKCEILSPRCKLSVISQDYLKRIGVFFEFLCEGWSQESLEGTSNQEYERVTVGQVNKEDDADMEDVRSSREACIEELTTPAQVKEEEPEVRQVELGSTAGRQVDLGSTAGRQMELGSTAGRQVEQTHTLKRHVEQANTAEKQVSEGSPNVRQKKKNSANVTVKKRLYDQVMLSMRLQEEKSILVLEMVQHCMWLQKQAEEIKKKVAENDQGNEGLCCLLRSQLSEVSDQLQVVLQQYRTALSPGTSVLLRKEGEDQSAFSSSESSDDKEDVTT